MTKIRARYWAPAWLALRDIVLPLETGPGQVKIKIHTVGVCGSDVHYYTHGKIGPFIVGEPMVLGHEAAGPAVEVGAGVTHLRKSVIASPHRSPAFPVQIPRQAGSACTMSIGPLPFWATPPIHGVLTPEVVHPAN